MSKGKLLAVCLVWLVIFASGAMAWRWLVQPWRASTAEQAQEQARRQRLDLTSSESHYQHRIDFALDSFSGYAVLRSPEFRNQLGAKRIKLNLIDDAADYSQRINALRKGETQMAAFTVDALIKVCAQLRDVQDPPATIVSIIDETRGADAIVAYQSAVPNIDAMNRADIRFVLTPDSPSETLARVVMTHFDLDKLSADPFVPASDAQDVYQRYRNSKPDTPQVFVLWEPYVAKMLENPNTHVVVDSSRFRGYIVDVIVASRDFLAKKPDVVRDFVGCYFRAAHQHRDDMVPLVLEDAKQLGTPLTDKQAAALVDGVWWKNTQENFAHFGLTGGQPLQHIEDIVGNITDVLVSTGAIGTDPTGGQPNLVYYDQILQQLQQSNFHPGLSTETIRDDSIDLPALTDAQWEKLSPVGTLEVAPLIFARGTSRLTEVSRRVLDDLVAKLNTWPQYYVLVRGNASQRGDLAANQALAEARARTAEDYLIRQGISGNRVCAIGVEPSGTTSVSFMLGEMPY